MAGNGVGSGGPVPDREMPSAKRSLEIIISRSRGFSAGVVRAIDVVERALEVHGVPVYVRHEIGHNKRNEHLTPRHPKVQVDSQRGTAPRTDGRPVERADAFPDDWAPCALPAP